MEWVEFTTDEYPTLLEGNIGCSVPRAWGFYVKLLLDSFVWDQEIHAEFRSLRVRQIKEKFGSLRVYCDTSELSDLDSESVGAKIAMTELICSHTCVECGSHNDVVNTTKQDGRWLSPRCPLHR
jgi:ribosomal protein S26